MIIFSSYVILALVGGIIFTLYDNRKDIKNSLSTSVEYKNKAVVLSTVVIVVAGYFFISSVYVPYFTASGRESRSWKKEQERTQAVYENACYLNKENPIYMRLKKECDAWRRGDCGSDDCFDRVH